MVKDVQVQRLLEQFRLFNYYRRVNNEGGRIKRVWWRRGEGSRGDNECIRWFSTRALVNHTRHGCHVLTWACQRPILLASVLSSLDILTPVSSLPSPRYELTMTTEWKKVLWSRHQFFNPLQFNTILKGWYTVLFFSKLESIIS